MGLWVNPYVLVRQGSVRLSQRSHLMPGDFLPLPRLWQWPCAQGRLWLLTTCSISILVSWLSFVIWCPLICVYRDCTSYFVMPRNFWGNSWRNECFLGPLYWLLIVFHCGFHTLNSAQSDMNLLLILTGLGSNLCAICISSSVVFVAWRISVSYIPKPRTPESSEKNELSPESRPNMFFGYMTCNVFFPGFHSPFLIFFKLLDFCCHS